MKPTPTPAQIGARAADLRKRMTPSQARLWSDLKGRKAGGFKFRREHPLPPYILDFYCPEVRIAAEVDGGAHESDEQRAYDQRRDAVLERAGIKVLRVPALALLHQPERVAAWIVSRCEAAATAPPSRGASRSRHLPISDGEET